MVINIGEEEQECIICLLNKNDNQEAVNVQTLDALNRSCDCRYLIHEPCLKTWIIRSPLCPICQQLLLFNTDIEIAREIKFNQQTNYGANSRLCACILFLIIVIIIFSTSR